MDKIINVLLLIIIFVFDPLAISLVIAANFAFDKAYPKKKYRKNLYGEKVEDIVVKDAEEIKTNKEFMDNLDKIEKIKDWEEAEKRMNIIGQNGNDGEHYSELDLNKDGKVNIKDRLLIISKLKSLQKEFKGNIKGKLVKFEKELHNMDVRKE
tara:strand:- start:260 stop:718 length:459 start_codon:yes stop_codon:yes gene_type:complete